MNRSLTSEIFVICCAGAFIGALIALHAGIFWPVGVIVGGLIGYLGVQWREIPVAARQVARVVLTGLVYRPRLNWSRCRFNVKVFGLFWLSYMVFSLWGSLLNLLVLFAANMIHHEGGHYATQLVYFSGAAATIGGFLAWKATKDEVIIDIPFMLKYSPIAVGFYWLPRGIVFGVPRLPHCLVRLGKVSVLGISVVIEFLRIFLVLIHSRLRVLCAIDAAIGALIGYFCGSAPIGALAGGIIGLVNYEFITVRFLRLAPSLIRR